MLVMSFHHQLRQLCSAVVMVKPERKDSSFTPLAAATRWTTLWLIQGIE